MNPLPFPPKQAIKSSREKRPHPQRKGATSCQRQGEPEQMAWRGSPGFTASASHPSAVHSPPNQHEIFRLDCFFGSSILPCPIKLIKLNKCVCFFPDDSQLNFQAQPGTLQEPRSRWGPVGGSYYEECEGERGVLGSFCRQAGDHTPLGVGSAGREAGRVLGGGVLVKTGFYQEGHRQAWVRVQEPEGSWVKQRTFVICHLPLVEACTYLPAESSGIGTSHRALGWAGGGVGWCMLRARRSGGQREGRQGPPVSQALHQRAGKHFRNPSGALFLLKQLPHPHSHPHLHHTGPGEGGLAQLWSWGTKTSPAPLLAGCLC